MPARQPFTALCQAIARSRWSGRADLHLHTTHSDGTYAPAQLVDLARRSGLAAISVTDHDTISGVAEGATAAAGTGVEVIAGVEISSEYRGAELHLLGYFVDTENSPLRAALERLRRDRVDRFWEMAARLRHCGVAFEDEDLRAFAGPGTLGRRNLAAFLVQTRQAGSVREAFARYLGDRGRATVPKAGLPVADAIARVRGAAGVAAWAHPSYDCTLETLAELRAVGLGAVEVEYPGIRPARKRELRALAAELGLAVTGGSDCHGPEPPYRAVGACSISADELERLRQMISQEN
jgi:predicted metal-dependent phosphoesterase TrpH